VFFTPDSSLVDYAADQETDGVAEIYGVPVDGSAAPVRLSGALPSWADVVANAGTLRITPDGARVVFLADRDADDVLELYVAPIDGSAEPLELNAPLPADTEVDVTAERGFRISPDSRLVVYATRTARPASRPLHEIFLVPIDRALEPVKLHGPLAHAGYPISSALPAGGIETFEITADSRRVLYSATVRTQVLELFSTVLTFEPARGRLGVGDL
jgi:hypothetical protein